MKKNVLLVGDLRVVENYGAVATTEALIEMLNEHKDIDIKTIDYRSMMNNTPDEGWKQDVDDFIANENQGAKFQTKKILKRIHIYEFIKKIVKPFRKKVDEIDYIPARYDMYENVVKEIKNGVIWKYEKKMIEWSDLVLINAEGNIVNGTNEKGIYRRGGRYLLFFAYVANRIYGKECYIINHTVDPGNRDIKNIIKNIYPLLDGVYVREKKSYQKIIHWGIKNCKYVPDALWAHDFKLDSKTIMPLCIKNIDFDKPYICIGDSSGLENAYTKVKWDIVKVYSSLIKQIQNVCTQIVFIDGYNGANNSINEVIKCNNLPVVKMQNCNYHQLYCILENADIFISGRWHASIISLMAHTPILLWGADSHKTEALYGEIEYKYEFFDIDALPLNIDRIVDEMKKIINDSHEEEWRIVDRLKLEAKNNVEMI